MTARKKSSILIVDDSAMVREYIKDSLAQADGAGWRFYDAENGRIALEIMRRRRIDLVLCDVMMPEMDGFTFLEVIRGMSEFTDVPVIMLTAAGSVEKKVRGFEAGASDYLVKPFEEAELTARVRVHLKIKRLQDELRRANERYRKFSITDFLTGVYNRRYFMQLLEREFVRAMRYSQPLSLVILDIDHFKRFNDEFGHLQGDRILVEMGRLLKINIRSHDVLARYGGEEFVVLLPMVGENIGWVAEKLRRIVEEHAFPGIGDRRLTVSMGGCTYPARGVRTVDDLIAKADKGLYRAKRGGRNRVVVRTPVQSKVCRETARRGR